MGSEVCVECHDVAMGSNDKCKGELRLVQWFFCLYINQIVLSINENLIVVLYTLLFLNFFSTLAKLFVYVSCIKKLQILFEICRTAKYVDIKNFLNNNCKFLVI